MHVPHTHTIFPRLIETDRNQSKQRRAAVREGDSRAAVLFLYTTGYKTLDGKRLCFFCFLSLRRQHNEALRWSKHPSPQAMGFDCKLNFIAKPRKYCECVSLSFRNSLAFPNCTGAKNDGIFRTVRKNHTSDV